MYFKKILFTVSILLSNTLYQQDISPRLDLSAQQAWEYFGNKSTIRPQIIKVQGSQYYNEEFKLSDLEYFGRKMDSIGYMRYDAYNDVIEMANTPDIERSEILLLKNSDVIATINDQEYVFLEYDEKDIKNKKGYMIRLYSGDNYSLYQKKVKIFKEAEKTKAGITESQPPRYISKTDFYIQTRDQKPELVKISKKSLINFFKNQTDVKEFIKENKLKVREIESIILIIEFANKIANF
tara:strand:+ start:3725 stop:4438 length:714 start_codon:yes stop_codon:yes gene_type:complete